MYSGSIGYTLTDNRCAIYISPQTGTMKEAELLIHEKCQKIFKHLCSSIPENMDPKKKVSLLLSESDLAEMPEQERKILNSIHFKVKELFQKSPYLNGSYPIPTGNNSLYCLPKDAKVELFNFATTFPVRYPDYYRFYYQTEQLPVLEPKYQASMDIEIVEEFATFFNNSSNKGNIKALRTIALEKITQLKMIAYKEGSDEALPEIDPQEISRARLRLFQMFKYCDDFIIRKKSLLELNDLIESDPLSSQNLGEIVTLHKEMELFLTEKSEEIQGKLTHVVIETFAKILSLILLYSSKESKQIIVIDEATKQGAKKRVDALEHINVTGDKEAEFWQMISKNCQDLLNTNKTDKEKKIDIAGAFFKSTIEVVAAVTASPTELVTALDNSYQRIRTSLSENLPSPAPLWLPPIVGVNRYCQKTMHCPEEFKKIIPTLRKFKHVTLQEVRYGIIITLERVVLKTRFEEVEIETMKLLLQYINIHNETITYRFLKAFGRILNFRPKTKLSNTAYIILTLIDETGALFGEKNKEKLKRKLEKYKKAHPNQENLSTLQIHTYLVKYFLKEHGFIDDFGGQPAGFLALSSMHTNLPQFHTGQASLLRRLNEIIAITEPDVYGNTLYHAAVINKDFKMIPVLKESRLNIDVDDPDHADGHTALHLAVQSDYFEATSALLEGEPAAKPDPKNREGNTPLHLAVLHSPRALTYFLQRDINICPVNKKGLTPIMLAIKNDLPEIAKELMEKIMSLGLNFDITTSLLFAIQMQKTYDQQRKPYKTLKTLLLLVGTLDYEIANKIIHMMVGEKGEQNCSEDFAKFHAYHLKSTPAYSKSFEPFTQCPQPRASISVSGFDLTGDWPVPKAPPVLRYMKDLKVREIKEMNFNTPGMADILNIADEFGNTALFYAAYYTRMSQFIPQLVRGGGAINTFNHLGYAPLHIAVIRGNVEAVRSLVFSGADIDIETNLQFKFTPLHLAAYLQKTEIVALLLSFKACPTKKTHFGNTALHMTCLYQLENDINVPDVSFIEAYDSSPQTTPVVQAESLLTSHELFHELKNTLKSLTLCEEHCQYLVQLLDAKKRLRNTSHSYHLPKLKDLPIHDLNQLKETVSLYELVLNIIERKKAITSLESHQSRKNDLESILNTMDKEFKLSIPRLASLEKRLNAIYILLSLFKFDPEAANKKDFFGNNILHISAHFNCPTLIKIINYYYPHLYWEDNEDQQLPIECALGNQERIFDIFNARNRNYVFLDWEKENQDKRKEAYILQMARDFDMQTGGRLPLRHLFARSNLSALFKRLANLRPSETTRQDTSIFKQTSLHVAARLGHIDILEDCYHLEIKHNISLLAQGDHFNNTAGHIAILKDQSKFAQKYISLNPHIIHAKNDDGRTMLHLAAAKGCLDMVTFLINEGASPLETDAHGDIPLHLACIQGYPAVVEHLITMNPESIQTVDEEGRSALHHACMMLFQNNPTEKVQRNTLAVIKILRDRQPDLDVRDASGTTPLMIAAANGFATIITILLGYDRDNQRSSDIHAQDINQRTALHYATMGKHLPVIRQLLIHDRDFHRYRKIPLFSIEDINNETPLLSLAKRLTPDDSQSLIPIDICKLFKEFGADLKGKDENGTTLLHWASQNGHLKLAEHLLSLGKYDLGENRNGNTALHYAALNGHLEIAALLVQHGAKANYKNKEGITPLMFSVKQGYFSITLYFLSLRVDLTTTDAQDQNFLHYLLQETNSLTQEEEQILIIAIVREPNLVRKRDGKERNTPLHLAGRNGNADALRVIIANYPYRDLLDVMIKTNRHGRDAKQEFEQRPPGKPEEGTQNFKDVWLGLKPQEVLEARPKRFVEYFKRRATTEPQGRRFHLHEERGCSNWITQLFHRSQSRDVIPVAATSKSDS